MEKKYLPANLIIMRGAYRIFFSKKMNEQNESGKNNKVVVFKRFLLNIQLSFLFYLFLILLFATFQ